MDSEWGDEDQYRGIHQTPKLILAGRVDLLIDGQPCVLRGEGASLLVEVRSLHTLLNLKSSWYSTLSPLHATMSWLNLRVFARVGWLGPIEVFPNPPRWIRWFLPRHV